MIWLATAWAADVPFAADSIVDVSSTPLVLPADFDHDGDVDALGLGTTGAFWLEQTGPGSFSKNDLGGLPANNAVLIDADGDADLDVVTWMGTDLALWLNSRPGFSLSTPIATGVSSLSALVAADFDDDGDVDLLTALGTQLRLHDNDGSWTPSDPDTTTSPLVRLAAGDIDRDGVIDVAGVTADGQLIWWDTLTWTAHPVDTAAGARVWVELADLNRDGKLDIVTSEVSTITVHQQAPSVTFVPTVLTPGGSVPALTHGDLDADGDVDLLFANDSGVRWYDNDGSWTLRTAAANLTGATHVQAVDLDRDGQLDVLAADSGVRQAENLRGASSTVFGAALEIAFDLQGSTAGNHAAAGDFDGDGDDDIVFMDYPITWAESPRTFDPVATWNQRFIDNSSFSLTHIRAADMDGDGVDDVISWGRSVNVIRLWKSRLEGTAWEQTDIWFDNGVLADDGHHGDADGDGDNDWFIARGQLTWRRNLGGADSWDTVDISTVDEDWWRIVAADFDQDGDVDVVAASEVSFDVSLWENVDGIGTTWAETVLHTHGMRPFSLDVGDLDGDGDDDVVVGPDEGMVIWLENPSWTVHAVQDFAVDDSFDVFVRDLDRDGDNDIIETNRSRDGIFHLNDAGDGTVWTDLYTPSAHSIAHGNVGDFDADGDLDLVIAGDWSNDVYVYENARAQLDLGAVDYDSGCSTPGVLELTPEHQGRPGDASITWTELVLSIDDGLGSALLPADVDGLFGNVRLTLDDGSSSGCIDALDTVLLDVAVAVDGDGDQQLVLPVDASLTFDVGDFPPTFHVAVDLEPDADEVGPVRADLAYAGVAVEGAAALVVDVRPITPVASFTWPDADSDGVSDGADNCLTDFNPTQTDLDTDDWGAACDCDDDDDTRNPGENEIPADGIDQDCNGGEDCFSDVDRDGFGSSFLIVSSDFACDDPGLSDVDTDCDDDDDTVFPGAPEVVADGIDQNCDTDELCYVDLDGDNHSDDSGATVLSNNLNCTNNGEGELPIDDCDDDDFTVFVGAPELCDGVDNDCDGLVDDDDTQLVDGDGDGVFCGDCDPLDPTIFPGAHEICGDGVDQDCDGNDPSCISDDFDDQDGDGFCVASSCNGNALPGDCDETDAAINPYAAEVCDGVDNDCNGLVDELGGDADNDGYTVAGSCTGSGDDCDDLIASVNPGGTEVCNGLDDDCNGFADEGLVVDFDNDGFPALSSCVVGQADCDDTIPTTNPNAPELPADGIDNDCDGDIDEAPGTSDTDGDGYCEDTTACTDGSDPGDCDDSDPSVHPGAAEVVDGVDNDCDGSIDNADADEDADGFTIDDGDCDDTDPDVFPGATETCNGLDDDCDGILDPSELDVDLDGFRACVDCEPTDPLSFPGAREDCSDGIDNDCDGTIDLDADVDGDGWTVCRGDCDDTDDSVHPGALELCNDVDDDCDRVVDEGFDLDQDGAEACTACGSQPGCDCNDFNALAGPFVPEICGDGVDNNCDGFADVAVDQDGDGWDTCSGDCDDADPFRNPGRPEFCNAIDDDCDGAIDEVWDLDSDGVSACAGDCDDDDDTSFLGGFEVCDDADNDCDGTVDEGFDADDDGATTCGGDCDDADDAVFPGADDTCNDIDDDCDGVTDPDCETDDTDTDLGETDTDGERARPPASYPGHEIRCATGSSSLLWLFLPLVAITRMRSRV